MNKLKLRKLRRFRNALIADDGVYIGTGALSAQHHGFRIRTQVLAFDRPAVCIESMTRPMS